MDLSRPMGSWRKVWLIACHKAGVRYRWHDLRHTFVSWFAESPSIREQTIQALAGHVSRQMFEHIATSARRPSKRQFAVSKSKRPPVFEATGHKIGHTVANEETAEAPNSLQTNGGPARIRTWDRRIMSPLL